jgi:hypothetical protein
MVSTSTNVYILKIKQHPKLIKVVASDIEKIELLKLHELVYKNLTFYCENMFSCDDKELFNKYITNLWENLQYKLPHCFFMITAIEEITKLLDSINSISKIVNPNTVNDIDFVIITKNEPMKIEETSVTNVLEFCLCNEYIVFSPDNIVSFDYNEFIFLNNFEIYYIKGVFQEFNINIYKNFPNKQEAKNLVTYVSPLYKKNEYNVMITRIKELFLCSDIEYINNSISINELSNEVEDIYNTTKFAAIDFGTNNNLQIESYKETNKEIEERVEKMQIVKDFMEKKCVPEKNNNVKSSSLFSSFKYYCNTNNIQHKYNNTSFSRFVKQITTYEAKRSSDGVYWINIKLKKSI